MRVIRAILVPLNEVISMRTAMQIERVTHND